MNVPFDVFGNNEWCLTYLVYVHICQHWELGPFALGYLRELHLLLKWLMVPHLSVWGTFSAVTLNHWP